MKLLPLAAAWLIGVLNPLQSEAQQIYEPYAFATLAGKSQLDADGNPIGSSANGIGNEARFNGVDGVAVDTAGNVYTTEFLDHSIRKITPDGEVTTFAGAIGESGSADGTATEARFNRPYGLAADTAGNIFVADTFNHLIRKITPEGVVTTVAGSAGDARVVNGIGTAARFNIPAAIAVDEGGNLYVAEPDSKIVRKILPSGEVISWAGRTGVSGSANGQGAQALFAHPFGLVAAPDGTVYVCDRLNHSIRKITPSGNVSTFAGASGTTIGSRDGIGRLALFNTPFGIGLDKAGNVYVGDRENHLIRKITPAAEVTTIAGAPRQKGDADGRGSNARFNRPCGIAVSSAGVVYAADLSNNTVRKGLPFKLINPLTRLYLAGPHFGREEFGATALSLENENVEIETSADLKTWSSLGSYAGGSFNEFVEKKESPMRFYRARIP